MSNVYARVVDLDGGGTGGGGGALIVAERSDNSNPAIFADFAALEAYTGTDTGTADAARINVENAANAQEVFAVGTVNGDDQVMTISAAYIRLSDAWVAVTTNLVGSPGTNGTNGLDGNALEFTSEAARDTFFQGRPDLLRTDLPINVSMGNSTVTVQVWVGQDSPSFYDPATQAIFFQAASVRTSTGSLELGTVHNISSGGENVFTTNNISDTSYFPPWQFVGNHSTQAGRIVGNRPTARVYTDLTQDEIRGPVSPTGAVAYDVTTTLASATSLFGVRIVAAEAFTGRIIYVVSESIGNGVIFEVGVDINVAVGDDITIWFTHPIEGRAGQTIRGQILKEDLTLLQVRPITGESTPYVELQVRSFTDTGLAYQSEAAQADWDEADNTDPSFIQNKPTIPAAPVQSDWDETDTNALAFIENKPTIPVLRTASETADLLETLTGDERLDASAVRNLPADVDNYVDTVDLSVSGQDLTITLGRTGVLADLTDTITLPAGGTTPTASIHGFSLNISQSVETDTVLTTTPIVTYSVANHAQVQSLTVNIDGTDYSLTVPTRDGEHTETVTLSQAIPTAAARTVTNTLTGINTDSGALNTLNYNLTVFVPVVAPEVFYGLSDANDPATVDVATLTEVNRTDPLTVATGTTSANDYFILLVPDDDDVTRITDTVLQQDVTDIFVRTASVRTIGAITYNSYVIGPLNAGVDEEYVVRF